MLTGVTVESFSYVFQSSGGVLKLVTRREIRAFKKAWAEFSDLNSRLLERQNLVPFLAVRPFPESIISLIVRSPCVLSQKLSGVFEVRIYPPQYSTTSLLAACQDKSKKDGKTGGIHVRKLNRLLKKIDFGEIRKRRALYTRICHEANMMYYRGSGISFTDMLALFAHHKLIDDREALG